MANSKRSSEYIGSLPENENPADFIRDITDEEQTVYRRIGEDYSRNRPGSMYVKVDLSSEETFQLVVQYASSLEERSLEDQENLHYSAPEVLPLQTDLEKKLLKRFLDSDGELNFWDIGRDIAEEHGGKTPYFLQAAIISFVANLQLVPKKHD